MKELKTLIKQALKKAGLDEGLAEKIKVTEESQIDAEIEKLKGKIDLTSDQFIEAVKEAGLEGSLGKYMQSEIDRRVTQAVTTHDLKLAKEKEEAVVKTKADEAKEKEQADMSDSDKKISNLTEEVIKLTGLVKDLSGSTVKTKRETLIRDALKKADLSEGFLSYITVEKDEEIDDSIKKLKDQVLEAKQAELDIKLKDGVIPEKGDVAGSIGEETAITFAQEKNKGSGDKGFEGLSEEEITKGKEIKEKK